MDKVKSLVEQVLKLPSIQQRKIAAVLGAVVADAATRPVHWVYDAQKLDEILKTSENPEFLPQNHSPFYIRDTGFNSCYGDEIVVALDYLYKNSGVYNYESYTQHLYDFFSKEDGEYQVAFKLRPNGYPVPGPWIQKALLHFIENYQKKTEPYGSVEVQENDAICTSIPLVALLSGQNFDESVIQKHINVVINNPSSALGLTTAKLLNKIIQRSEEEYTKQNLQDDLLKLTPEDYTFIVELVIDGKDTPHIDFVAKNGKACNNPGSFQGSLHSVLVSENYVEAVRNTIRAGGCNCSRVNSVGAIFGAIAGINAIPLNWILQTKNGEQVLEQCLKIYQN